MDIRIEGNTLQCCLVKTPVPGNPYETCTIDTKICSSKMSMHFQGKMCTCLQFSYLHVSWLDCLLSQWYISLHNPWNMRCDSSDYM